MTIEPARARATLMEVHRLLNNPSLPLEERVRQANAVLATAIAATCELPFEARATLDADPTTQEALSRLQRGRDTYVMAGPDAVPSITPIIRDPTATDLDDEGLAALGL